MKRSRCRLGFRLVLNHVSDGSSDASTGTGVLKGTRKQHRGRHVTWPTSVCRRGGVYGRSSPVSLCSLRGSPGALDSDVYWPEQLCCVWPQDRLPTALRSPELSLASFKRQLKTHLSVPALDSAGCSCGCRVPSSHRRCCDCTASLTPTANVQTRFDSKPLFIRTRPVFAPAGCSHGDAGCRYHYCNNLLCTTTVWMFVVFCTYV